jgi:hypothetical protein
MSCMRAFQALSSLVLLCAPLSAQEELYQIWGPAPWSNFGNSVAIVGDIDGDGGDDYWVGAPGARDSAGRITGVAYLHSGKTGELRRSVDGKTVQAFYGAFVTAIGDVDGDGAKDVLIAAPQIQYVPYKSSYGPPSGPGFVEIRSGADGTFLREHVGAGNGTAFGKSGCDIGDVDGDGVSDYAIGAPRISAGTVYVHSGASGALLRVETAPLAYSQGWGFFLAPLADIDGDGVPEHLVSSIPASTQQGSFAVTCVSGADGSHLWTALQSANTFSEFGYCTLAIDDKSGDGLPEVLVGAKRTNQYVGSVSWLDGASGLELDKELGNVKFETMGAALAWCGDLDGDGVGEVAVGSPSEGVPYGWAARGFRIWSAMGGPEKVTVLADPQHPLSFSTSMAIGDVDGDGQEDDMVIGSPNEDIAYIRMGGRVEVYTDLLGLN